MTTIERAVREFRRSMAIMAVFSLATNGLLLITPLYLLQIYDRVLPSRSNETLVFLSVLAAFALIVLGLLEVVRSILANRAAARLDTRLSDPTLRTVIRFGSMAGGNVQPMRDTETLRGLLSSKLVFGVLDLPFASLFIALMYLIHPALFWLTLAGAVLLLAIVAANQFFSARANARQGLQTMRAGNRAEHLARNADSVVAMGMLGNVVERWGREHADSLAAADAVAAINAWFAGLSRTVRLGLQIAILGYGAHLVLAGEMTAGLIFASSLISGRALQPIDQTVGSWRQLVGGWQAWRRVSRLLQNTDRPAERTAMATPTGRLEVAEVVQPDPADPAKPPILKGVSFRLQPGEVLAIVGPSGAGKSTLARLIVGASRLRIGRITLDGYDIASQDSEELGRHVGYLAQDVELIPGTIAENIARFDPDRKDAAVIAAARRAHAEELILGMTGGYDALVGPGGLRPSGGEKQRIALARALYRDPCLLVLDEPNAHLDAGGEEALRQTLLEAKKAGTTVIVITQRLTVLPVADKIMHLVAGAVVDFGGRDEVISRLGIPAEPRSEKLRTQLPGSGGAPSRFIPVQRASVEQKK